MTRYILNLLDLAFTIHAVSHGGVELNPLMQNVPFMVFFKTIIVGILCWWLGHRKESAAIWGRRALTAILAVVNAWHIFNLAAYWVAQ